MASFLQNANPWIENTFTYASSFNPDTGEGFSGGGGTTTAAGGGTPNSDNLYNSSQYYEQSQSQSEPQTNNTIPSGLLPSPDERGGGDKVVGDNTTNANGGTMSIQGVAPSRQSKIAQVICRGGNFEYYKQQMAAAQQGAIANADNNSSSNKNVADAASTTTTTNSNCCPPYLIIHDGQYSAITFLSPKTIAAMEEMEDGSTTANNMNIPPNKSLISITHYTVSTIYQCTNNNSTNSDNNTIIPIPNTP